jgi:hypothetical protein
MFVYSPSALVSRMTIHHSGAAHKQVNSARMSTTLMGRLAMPESLPKRRSRQREQLILALLQQPGLEKAATSIGISSATAWRMTKTVEFKEEYRQARREAFSQLLGRLQHGAGAAVSTLLKIMLDVSAPWASRVRAADRVLGYAESALELEDIQVRLARLEEIQTDKKGNA